MCISFELDETVCCALRIISEEYYELTDNDKRPTITKAAKAVREKLEKQRKGVRPATTVIATVAEGELHDTDYTEWWKKVYKKAGFTQMGEGILNPNSGNTVTKFYINIPNDFEA